MNRSRAIGSVVAIFFLLASVCHAATLTWTGLAGDSNVSTAGNWTPSQVPAPGDTLIFSGTGSLMPYLSAAGLSVNALTFSGSSGAFTLGGPGVYTINTGGITNSVASLQTIANAIALSGPQTWASTGGNLLFDGTAINLGAETLTLATGTNAITISDPISGSGGLIENGTGILTLTGSSSFSGGTTLTGGTTILGNGHALGSGTLTLSGGSIEVTNGSQTLANPVSFASSTMFVGTGGNLTLTGTVGLTGRKTLTIDAGVVTLANTVSNGSGSDTLTEKGTGTLILEGTNTFSNFTLTSGTAVAANDSALGTATIALGNGTLESAGGALLFGNAITLAGSPSFSGTGSITFTGNATMNGSRTLTINNPTVTFDDAISQSSHTARNLTESGTGSLILSGNLANTFTGTTTVDSGTLVLEKTAGVNAIGGVLTVGDSNGPAGSAVAELAASNQIPDTATVSIRTDGLLNVQTYSDTIGALTMTGGSIIGSGTLNLGGNVTTSAVGTATASISPNLTLNGNRTFTINNNAVTTDMDLTVSGVISNGSTASSLTKAGAGMLALNGSNTYSGGTTLGAGGLSLGTSSAIGTGLLSLGTATLRSNGGSLTLSNALTLAGNTTFGGTGALIFTGSAALTGTRILTINNGSDTFNGAISQSTAGYGITEAGTGTLTLGGSTANSITGTVTVNGGTLRLDKSTGIAAGGNLVVGSGSAATFAQWLASNQMASTGSVTVNANGVLDLNGNNQTVDNLTVGGGASITMESGTLTLDGNVTHNGTGTVPATIAGTLNLGGTTCTFAIGDSAATQDLVISATIMGGGLTKTGAGLMALDGANTYAGSTTINQGTVQLGTNNAIGSASAITLSSGATLDLNSFNENALSLSGSGAVTLESGTLSLGGGVSNYSGSIAGSGGLVLHGNGMLMLNGTNSYTGATTVNSGTLEWLTANSAAPNSDVTVAAGATLSQEGATQTIGSLTGAGNVILETGTLTAGGDNASTGFSGAMSGSGGFVKTGAGLLTLSGSSSMTGGVTVGAGSVTLSGAKGALSDTSGVVIDNGATLTLDNSGTQNSNRINDGAAVTLDGGTFELISSTNGSAETVGALNASGGASSVEVVQNGPATNSTSLTFSSLGVIGAGATVNFSGAGGVLGTGTSGPQIYIIGQADGIMGGWATVGGGFAQYYADGVSAFSNYYLGSDGINVNDATKIVELSGNSPSTAFTLTNAGTTTDDNLNLTNLASVNLGATSTQTLNLAGGGLIKSSTTQTMISGAGNLTVGGTANGMLSVSVASGQTLTIASSIINNAGPDGTYGDSDDGVVSLSLSNAGTLILSGSNSYSGNTYLNGGTLQVSSEANLGAGTSAVIFQGGTLAITSSFTGGAGEVFSVAPGDTGTLNVAANQVLTVGNASNLFITGIASTLFKSGSGGLIIQSANSNFDGSIVVDAGMLELQNPLSLGSNGAVTLNGGTLLLHNDHSANFGNDVTVTGNAGIDPGLLDGIGGAVTQSLGTLSIGAQTLTTTSSNGAALSFGAVTLTGNATFNTATANTTLGSIAGEFGITKTGTAALILAGASTYTGPTLINAGKAQLGSATGIGAESDVTVAKGAILDLNNFNAAIASLSGTGNVALEGATLSEGGYSASTTYSGVLSGSGGFTKNGAGTFTMSGANSYTGTTTIDGGILALGAPNAICAASTITIAYGAGLDLNGVSETAGSLNGGGTVNLGNGGALTIGGDNTETTFSGVITGTGALTKLGAGIFTLSGANDFTGAVALNAGTLSIDTDSELGNSGNALSFDGGTLQATSSITTNRAVVLNSGGGTIDTGTNNVTLSGAISGDGDLTEMGSGALLLSANNTYSGGTVLTAGELIVENNAALGSGPVSFNGGSLASNSDSISISNALSFTGTSNNQITGNNSLTLTGTAGGSGSVNIDFADATKTVTLNPVVDSGFAPGAIIITNGTLLIARSQAVGTVTNLTLDGGTFSMQGLTGATQTMGVLTLDANSTIDFSSSDGGGNTLQFSSLDLNGFTLTINDWSGDAYSSSDTTDLGPVSQDRLLFTTSPAGNNLTQVIFYDDTGTLIGTGQQVTFGTTLEVVPVPEPGDLIGVTMLITLIGCRGWRCAMVRRRSEGEPSLEGYAPSSRLAQPKNRRNATYPNISTGS